MVHEELWELAVINDSTDGVFDFASCSVGCTQHLHPGHLMVFPFSFLQLLSFVHLNNSKYLNIILHGMFHVALWPFSVLQFLNQTVALHLSDQNSLDMPNSDIDFLQAGLTIPLGVSFTQKGNHPMTANGFESQYFTVFNTVWGRKS